MAEGKTNIVGTALFYTKTTFHVMYVLQHRGAAKY